LPCGPIAAKDETVHTDTFALAGADGVALFVYRWLPEAAPKAVVQIAHGLVEHAGRYARLAEALTSGGYAVYAGDHRGHGRTAPTPEDLGFFSEQDGWRRCADDLWGLNQHIAAKHPRLPIVLIGHSMGSFMAQHFISEHGEALSGVVLAGSSGKPAWRTLALRTIARVERFRLGSRGRSALVHGLAFGSFNKQFAPVRTEADWLSRDSAQVDKYVADPLCRFRPTLQLWIDLLGALSEIANPSRQALIPKQLPIYVIAGTRDPVSANSKGLQQLLCAYRAAGLQRVSYRFYPEARHELFNETNRDEVTRELLAWLDETTGAANHPGRGRPKPNARRAWA
jgi:alpha-beta hydrolase superfamily lysophospholipase